MSEHRKALRVCAKYRRRIKAYGVKPPPLVEGLDLWQYASMLVVVLEVLD